MTSSNDEQPRDPDERERAAEAALTQEILAPGEGTGSEPRGLTVINNERLEMRTVYDWGRLMYASGFFNDARSAAQAAVKILAGRELGFSVMQSMVGFHVIEGKITASAHLMAHAVKRSDRYDYRITQHDDTVCVIEFLEKRRGEWESAGPASAFSIEDARNAGLLGRRGMMWEKYPRNMLFARAMSNGIAFYCPDVFDTRVYTPDEINPDLELTDAGEVRDIEAITVQPRDMGPDLSGRGQPQQQQERRPQQPRPAQQQRREPEHPHAATPPGVTVTAAPARKRSGLDMSDVVDLPSLQLWQWERWKGDSVTICRELGIANIAEASERFTAPEDWQEAARRLLAHFAPDEHRALVESELEIAQGSEGQSIEVDGDGPQPSEAEEREYMDALEGEVVPPPHEADAEPAPPA